MSTDTIEYVSVLDEIDELAAWQDEHPNECSRCGVVMEDNRPLNTMKLDRRIHVCDGCVFIDTVLNAGILKDNTEKVSHDFLDAREWVALGGEPRGE